jgi:hypothetical protein
MLLVLIPIAWILLLTLFAALCRAAAEGDGRYAPRHRAPISAGAKLTLSPAAHARSARSRRSARLRPALARATRLRRPTHTHRAR